MSQHFINLVKAKWPDLKPETIFDIGARDCLESVLMAKSFPSAKVYAFEANPNQILRCNLNRRDAGLADRIEVLGVAVSSKDGQETFNVATTANVGYSSLRTPSGKYDHIEQMPMKQVWVHTIRLDTFINRDPKIAAPSLIWLDCQGSELDALKSLGDYIYAVQAVWTEVVWQEMYSGEPLYHEVFAWMKSKGFAKVFEQIVMKDPKDGSAWWGDACFMRDE